jgi:hypothetical protein
MSSTDLPESPDASPGGPLLAAPPAAAVPKELLALGKYLYNHNPFYPLSAVFVLLGLHSLFHDEHAAAHLTEIGFNNAILWGVLAGYATLLAATAVWIVRWGRVWDDARTILLTLVLLLVAMSVNCDKPISLHVPSAPLLLLGGLAFAIVLAEFTLKLTGIALPVLFRVPMHLFFALYFLYPIGLDYCLNTIGDQHNATGWRYTLLGVLLFPTAAAAITLSLLPAAMRGPNWIARPTAAWAWPAYPWSLYVVLGVAVVLRAFYLTISFHPREGTDSAFALYFLTPLAVAAAAVVFELGRGAQHRLTQHVALATPLLWLLFALTGKPPCDPSGDFLCLHVETFGSPMQVTVAGLLVLYVYGWLRNGPAWLSPAIVGLICLASVVGPHTVDVANFGPVNWMPLAVAAGLCLIGSIRQPQSSFRWFAAATLGVICATVAAWETPLVSYRGVVPIHLWLGLTAVIAFVCRDAWSRVLRSIVAAGVVALAYGVMVYSARSWYGLSPWMAWGYLLALTSLAWVAWMLHRSTDQLATATLVSVAAAVQSVLTASSIVRESGNPRGWALVLAGTVCFLLGMLISASKMRKGIATS